MGCLQLGCCLARGVCVLSPTVKNTTEREGVAILKRVLGHSRFGDIHIHPLMVVITGMSGDVGVHSNSVVLSCVELHKCGPERLLWYSVEWGTSRGTWQKFS